MTTETDLSRSPGVQGLLQAVRSGSVEVAVGALKALVLLKLEPPQWFAVADATLDLLSQPNDLPNSRGDIIAAAVHVPVEEVRDELRRLIESRDESEAGADVVMPGRSLPGTIRLAAAYSLARAGDPAAFETLLDIVTTDPDAEHRVAAAHGLTLVDSSLVAAQAEAIQEVAGHEPIAEARLFLAEALARAGIIEPLVEALDYFVGPDAVFAYYGDPLVLTAQLRACGSLPESVIEAVFSRLKLGDLGQTASQVLAGLPRSIPADVNAPDAAVDVIEQTADPEIQAVAARAARDLVNRLRENLAIPGGITAPPITVDLRTEAPLLANMSASDATEVVHELVHLIDVSPESSIMLGNWLVGEVVPSFRWGWHPNIVRLFEQSEHAHPDQVAWLASRAGIPEVVDALGPIVAGSDEPAQAARAAAMIEGAIKHLDFTMGPVFGGGVSAAAPSPPSDLLRMPSMAMAEPPEAEPAAGETREAETEAVPPPRFVQVLVLRANKPRLTFLAGADNLVRCWIGPDEAEDLRRRVVADVPISEAFVPPEGLLLDVTLIGDEEQKSQGTLLLPAGPGTRSGDCDLHLKVASEALFVSAELVFTFRGRVFEFLKLAGKAVQRDEDETDADRLQLKVQARRREVIDLTSRDRFDAAIIQQDDSLIEVGPAGVGKFTFAGLEPVVDWLNESIFATDKDLVRARARLGSTQSFLDLDDETTRILLIDLARHGNLLYKGLMQQGFNDPGQRIQLVNLDPDRYVPLEFIYDRGNPADDATLSEACLQALIDDLPACPNCVPASGLTSEQRDRNQVICPFGFWSLQKVIERHDQLPEDTEGSETFPSDAAQALRPVSSVLYGVSDKVLPENREQLRGTVEEIFAQRWLADSWDTWKTHIGSQPTLLLALPHHDSDRGIEYLEIAGSKLELGRSLELYVRASGQDPGSIMLLLGCETDKQGVLGYTSFARAFSRHGAPVVIGTLSKVLGRNAVPVAQELIRELSAMRDQRTSLGAILRRIRRHLFGHGYLMALALVAHGDADWFLAAAGGD